MRLVSGSGGGGGPRARKALVAAGTKGAIYTVRRVLGAGSTLTLLAGTDPNLSFAAGSITAQAALADGAVQKAVIREANGDVAFEYPITITAGALAPPDPPPAGAALTFAGQPLSFASDPLTYGVSA